MVVGVIVIAVRVAHRCLILEEKPGYEIEDESDGPPIFFALAPSGRPIILPRQPVDAGFYSAGVGRWGRKYRD